MQGLVSVYICSLKTRVPIHFEELFKPPFIGIGVVIL